MAAKKEIVNARVEIVQQAGLEPVVLIDVDAFALQNAYEASFGSTTKETARPSMWGPSSLGSCDRWPKGFLRSPETRSSPNAIQVEEFSM